MQTLGPELLQTVAMLAQRHGKALALHHLVDAGLGTLPPPGGGNTLERWRVLAAVAAHDLSLAKLCEGHTDAQAILRELGAQQPPSGSLWGTWCAEPPDARVRITHAGNAKAARPGSEVRLHGTKAWCSGAALVTHAVVSGWNDAGEPCLAAIALDAPGVEVTGEGWAAIGMGASASVDVRFDGALGHAVGQPHDYVRRPGFWHGGAGIAACWWGGAAGIADRARALPGPRPDAHRLAHLGAMDMALGAAAALLRECAAWIDRHPQADARAWALRVRLAAEHCADAVLRAAARGWGAAPLCRNADFARAMTDLPVFVRQSHAERDLATLGALVLDAHVTAPGRPAWAL